MMIYNYTILIIFASVSFAVAMNSKEYGYFKAKVKSVEICKGPKHIDCCDMSATLLNENTIKFDMVITDTIIPTKAKVVASYKGKQMVRLPIKNPCDHVFIKPIMTNIFNTTSKCSILKGHYNINLDMADMMVNYYNGMFLYGNWTFKSTFWGEKCNLFCSITEFNVYPKN